MLRDLQKNFGDFVLDRTGNELVAGEIHRNGIEQGDRLAIYRNNTLGSLATAMQHAFPVVCRLLGENFFRRMARVFAGQYPPQAPQLLAYGADFIPFLQNFDPVKPLPYLPDVAKLEWLMNEAYFAEDAAPLAPETLQGVPPEAYGQLRFTVHPALRLMKSNWPVMTIWELHQQDTVTKEDLNAVKLQGNGQSILVHRPWFQVEQATIPTGQLALLESFAKGLTLEEAAAAALQEAPETDLQAALADCLQKGCFTAFHLPEATA
ncbi:DNA-binding domain-containing protein [Kiloniella sp. b19]|uniref:DNA-binding domain-containing protein n=1 Tax=Kiloniella sp. GXU_MW_B19 TaxID=3141326 RepID=UPI0031D07057